MVRLLTSAAFLSRRVRFCTRTASFVHVLTAISDNAKDVTALCISKCDLVHVPELFSSCVARIAPSGSKRGAIAGRGLLRSAANVSWMDTRKEMLWAA
jgi:hypothetical protein